MVSVLLVIGIIAGLALLVGLGRYCGRHPSFVQAEVTPGPRRHLTPVWQIWLVLAGVVGLAAGLITWTATASAHPCQAGISTRCDARQYAKWLETVPTAQLIQEFRQAAKAYQSYTYAQYSQLEAGMDRGTVERILGGPGHELSSNQLAGYVTVLYSWSNPDGSNLNVMFQNGAMIQKAQFGLR